MYLHNQARPSSRRYLQGGQAPTITVRRYSSTPATVETHHTLAGVLQNKNHLPGSESHLGNSLRRNRATCRGMLAKSQSRRHCPNGETPQLDHCSGIHTRLYWTKATDPCTTRCYARSNGDERTQLRFQGSSTAPPPDSAGPSKCLIAHRVPGL